MNTDGITKLALEEIKVATDLFYWKASTYLLIVDYYFRYIEISKLNGQSSSEMISHKTNLCQAWILQEVVSDKRPHIYPVNTSYLQPNMVSLIQQAAHTIFEVTGKQKEP